MIHSWQTQATDLQVEGCNGSGIVVTNTTPNGTALTGTEVNGSISGNFIQNSGQSGIYVQDTGNAVTDWHLDDNYIASSGQDAIHLDNAAGWYIDGNHLYGDGNSGRYANRLFGTSITTTTSKTSAAPADRVPGTASTGPSKATPLPPSRATGCSCSRPEVGNDYRYIALTKVNYGTGYVTVTSNDIRGANTPADTGFYYNAGSGVTLNVTTPPTRSASVGTVRTTGTGVTLSAGI